MAEKGDHGAKRDAEPEADTDTDTATDDESGAMAEVADEHEGANVDGDGEATATDDLDDEFVLDDEPTVIGGETSSPPDLGVAGAPRWVS